jgi:hypothetical protein
MLSLQLVSPYLPLDSPHQLAAVVPFHHSTSYSFVYITIDLSIKSIHTTFNDNN